MTGISKCSINNDQADNIFVFLVQLTEIRGGSRTAATFKMERFVIIVNGFQSLTIITKRSILDVAAVLDPHLKILYIEIFQVTISRLAPLELMDNVLES